MGGEVPFGTCSYCNKEDVLLIKYFYYDIECTCCGSHDSQSGKNTHFVRREHCKECLDAGKVVPPGEIMVYAQSEKYLIDKFYEPLQIDELGIYDMIYDSKSFDWYIVSGVAFDDDRNRTVFVRDMVHDKIIEFTKKMITTTMEVRQHKHIVNIRNKKLFVPTVR